MNDILPIDAPIWGLFEDTSESILKSYGFQKICTPIVESTALFTRGLGLVTDIVEKEMYSFTDSMNGDNLTLRPESTASVVRAAIENNITYDGPKKLWYSGPMFRHERPQRGRYRQFHQVGAEALGFSGPDIDVELIMVCKRLWNNLGLKNVYLQLNSIGNPEEQKKYRADLINYFERYKDLLDLNAQRRLYSNPLRILDTKNPVMQKMVNDAPRIDAYLGRESLAHFEGVKRILEHNNVPFTVNSRLVRGIDYYNRTVFEWVTDLLGAQSAICGGGRYDSLVEIFGGKSTPACGFAIGVERIIELIRITNKQIPKDKYDAYILHQGEAAQLQSLTLAECLRNAGLKVVWNCNPTNAICSVKSQMKRANASGATYAIIIGEKEVKNQQATVKYLLHERYEKPEESSNHQDTIPLHLVSDYLVGKIFG